MATDDGDDGLGKSDGTEDLPGARRPQRMGWVSQMELRTWRQTTTKDGLGKSDGTEDLAPDDHKGRAG